MVTTEKFLSKVERIGLKALLADPMPWIRSRGSPAPLFSI
jgi:hypothetical protein